MQRSSFNDEISFMNQAELISTEKESLMKDKKENEINAIQKVSKRSLKENKKDRKTKEQRAKQIERTE